MVLIDGDGAIFDDKFISQGEAGGREAARSLWNSVTEYVQQKLGNIPSDFKIVTRVYANLKGLGDVCRKAGLIDRSEMIEEFARGFTGSKQLFDFVDVGMGKDRADDKISGELSSCMAKLSLTIVRNIQITPLRLSLSAHPFWLFSRQRLRQITRRRRRFINLEQYHVIRRCTI